VEQEPVALDDFVHVETVPDFPVLQPPEELAVIQEHFAPLVDVSDRLALGIEERLQRDLGLKDERLAALCGGAVHRLSFAALSSASIGDRARTLCFPNKSPTGTLFNPQH